MIANSHSDALKSIGVIPRTPSPSPEPESEAEDRDPEDMTEEELRAVVRSMRVSRITSWRHALHKSFTDHQTVEEPESNHCQA